MIKLHVNGQDHTYDGDPSFPCSGSCATNSA